MNIKLFILSTILFLAIDSIYLLSIKNITSKMMLKIQKSEFVVKRFYAFLSYLLTIFALNYFIIQNDKLSNKNKYINAFILGSIIYGVYETTNMALFKNWDEKLLIIDTLWGGIIFFIITYISTKINI
jgi:uncharacterized membrane protein